jgi:hypothetical protein
MKRALIIAGVLAVSMAGGLAVAQQQGDPIGEVLREAAPKREEAPPANVPPVSTGPITMQPVVPEPAPAPTPSARAAAPKVAEVQTAPGKRPRYPMAVIQAVDKITAETIRFEAPVGKPVRYKSLIFTVRSCEATAADEVERDAIAHVEVQSQPPTPAGRPAGPARSVFRGWMFAASPSISPLEHPVYDAWLIACKAA